MFIKQERVETIEFDNLKIVDYTADHDMSSSIAEITVPVDASHKVSWSRRSDKYYYIVKGNMTFTVNEQTCSLSAGDVCVVQKGERFSYANMGPENAKLVLVHTPNFILECEAFED